MENQAIIQLLELYASLLELHAENEFKVRSYHGAIFNLERVTQPLAQMSLDELKKIAGIGKGIADKIHEINQKETFEDLDTILANTPKGLLQIFKIKGLGAKKIRTIWQELNITTPEELLEACESNKIAEVKGFGEKTQEAIKHSLMFVQFSADKLLYADAEPLAQKLEEYLKTAFDKIMVVGQIRRKLEIVDKIQILVETSNSKSIFEKLNECSFISQDITTSSPFTWRGTFKESSLKVEVMISSADKFTGQSFIFSAGEKHLGYQVSTNTSLLQLAQKGSYAQEEEIYQKASLPYIQPEMREGIFEFDWIKQNKLPQQLIELKDLRGVLHNHSTYSDGKHSLEEMAVYCKELGYEYLGITDHSKSAFYANGLYEKRIEEQHQEIDELNKKLAPFKIFKGIESDILADGALDYHDNILKSFDFIVTSVHANLNMSKSKATERLIKAVENPYTTILGHPTGRLLLRREGYPVDMAKVIDACAANKVAIEINAHPVRLDLDWRWVSYALDKGVKISINPDAHEKKGYFYMYFGVLIGRKGGLTKDMCVNAMNLADFETWLNSKN